MDRKCKLCNEIEDEYHAMLLCPRYPVLKKIILRNITLLNLVCGMYKFEVLFNAENIKEQQRLAVFTKYLFQELNRQL